MDAPAIHPALSREAIARCFEVMHELRPQLEPQSFIEQVMRQQLNGYHLVYLEHEGTVRPVAGYRLSENLAWGRFLFLDDLATRACDQGSGFGSRLFDWLVNEARQAGCAQVHLESGVLRHGAHRFYLHKGMDITCHHFAGSVKTLRLG